MTSTAGADRFADATPLHYGSVSDPTPVADLTTEPGDDRPGTRTAWWKVTMPSNMTPTTKVRFDNLLSNAGTGATGVRGDYFDTVLTIYKRTTQGSEVHLDPSDENVLDDYYFSNNDDISGGNGRSDLDATGFSPGDQVWVRVRTFSSGDTLPVNAAYILRVGTLGALQEKSDPITPPPTQFTFHRASNAHFGPITDALEGEVGYNDFWAANNWAGFNSAQGIGASGSFESMICPPVFGSGQGNYPIQGEAHCRRVVSETLTNPQTPSVGEDTRDNGNTLAYPDGAWRYSSPPGGGGNLGYSFTRKNFSFGFFGIGDTIACSGGGGASIARASDMYETALIEGETLDSDYTRIIRQAWSPGASGFGPPAGSSRYDWETITSNDKGALLPGIRMAALYRVPNTYSDTDQPPHAEPSDRLVFGIYRCSVPRTWPTFVDLIDNLEILSVEPMPPVPPPGYNNVDNTGYQENPYLYRVHDMPEDLRLGPYDFLVIVPSVAFVGGSLTPQPMAGVTLDHDIPSSTWEWRFGAPRKSYDELVAIYGNGYLDRGSSYSEGEYLSVQAKMGFEYRYQPPAFRWVKNLPRTTILAAAADFTWELDESGRLVHFDASSSAGGVAPIDTWEWDFHDTVRIPVAQPNGVPVLDHQFFALGPFEVTLTITAGGETSEVTKTVDLSSSAISGDYDNDRSAFSGAS